MSVSYEDEEESQAEAAHIEGAKILIGLYTFIFGGIWSNFLFSIIQSSDSLLLKGTAITYIMIVFICFSLMYLCSWKVLLLVFALIDGLMVLILNFYCTFSSLSGETMFLKSSMAMLSLVMLQVLVSGYVRLLNEKVKKSRSDSLAEE